MTILIDGGERLECTLNVNEVKTVVTKLLWQQGSSTNNPSPDP